MPGTETDKRATDKDVSVLVVLHPGVRAPEIIEAEAPGSPVFAQIRRLVGGFIETFLADKPARFPFIAYCDEDGKAKGLTANFFCGGDLIVGPVVFCVRQRAKNPEDGLEDRGLTTEERAKVLAWCKSQGRE